jgi:thiamine pyrophosphate-dependent acetolactate synthase large subunit-like protein
MTRMKNVKADALSSKNPSADIEQPEKLPPQGNALFGSDAIAETLRALDIPYIALNPGASYRGLHDSLVNHLGNTAPQMLLCLHEEHAVAIAQGWAKVTGKAMLVGVHSNVGLFHATMAIFNAWCDRMPVIVLGATGPVDAAKRRPWIEWIHTAQDQGAIVRPYVKWDAQPASPEAAREALLRAAWLSQTAPRAPVYVNLDSGLQEEPLTEALPTIDPNRFMPHVAASVPDSQIDETLSLLKQAKRPLFLMGRVGRCEDAWAKRVALAETFGAQVVTDLKVGAAFPTDHPLHVASPGVFPLPESAEAIANADLIISFDWVDLSGTLRMACGIPAAKVIQISLDHILHNGWSMDHQGLPPVDLFLAAEPDHIVSTLLARLKKDGSPHRQMDVQKSKTAAPSVSRAPDTQTDDLIAVPAMAATLRAVVGERAVSFLHLPLSWDGASWPFRHPLDFLGSDGGGGIGGGPGIAVGAALALRGSNRLPIAICGDGDFLMGVTALWTATHYRIPLLLVIANNQSFFNDEVHQERVARLRDRPVENKWIGMRMTDPELDLAGMARTQGAHGIGPVKRMSELDAAFKTAIAVVDAGGVAVVDVRVITGYTPAMASALTRAKP